MNDLGTILRHVRTHLAMYVDESSFDVVAALITGHDIATCGGTLAGFREWLVVRSDSGANADWQNLILRLAFPQSADPRKELKTGADAQMHAVRLLFELVEEFVAERASRDGLRRIFLSYERWLRQQSWYDSRSPAWFDLPLAPKKTRRKHT